MEKEYERISIKLEEMTNRINILESRIEYLESRYDPNILFRISIPPKYTKSLSGLFENGYTKAE